MTYFEYQLQSKLIIMKEHQVKKNCQAFINKLQGTNVYDTVRDCILNWSKQNDKETVPAVIAAFMKISKVVCAPNSDKRDDKLIEYFNRCLVKEAIVPKKAVTAETLEIMAAENPQANRILDNVQQWLKKDIKPIEKGVPKPAPIIEQIKQNAVMSRLEIQPRYREIVKVIQLYLKSIISFEQIRNLLVPIHALDPSLYVMLVQTCEQIIQKRRKATIFASLNELVDKKYPNYRVGESYILIPEGYANYSKNWKTNPLEYIMNRKCVSVPLGSEVSFVISKKTDYEEQLFSYEDQRYEIDNTLCSLKAIIKILSSPTVSPRKLESPLLQRVINELYPNQNVVSFFIRNAELSRNVLLPRVIQKRDELLGAREKFIKICEDVAAKNFYKSLDYRCYYFAKNDKRFNCPARWEKEIEMRRTQILQNRDFVEEELIEDRESLQRGRFFYVNSFDNITKENFIDNNQTKLTFDHKKNTQYPKYPDNQILFILNFSDQQVLNDVLEVVLHFCNRKNLLELLIFKLMRTDIKRRLKKSSLLNYLIDTKQKIVNNAEIVELFNNLRNPSYAATLEQQGIPAREEVLLNESKGFAKNYKDEEEEFNMLIEEDEDPMLMKNQLSPFEGPDKGYTLIATKQIYLFLRYITAIYQRFLKAKEYSQQMSSQEGGQKSELEMYNFFLTVIYKIKQRKSFEENLRKIFCKNAFIFFTLEKMITSVVKMITNFTPESLTFQIIKDQTKDYEMGAFEWEKYQFPNTTMQLTRLYHEKQTLFRFTYEPQERNVYISAWNPPFKDLFSLCARIEDLAEMVEEYTVRPTPCKPARKTHCNMVQMYNAQEIAAEQAGRLILRGEFVMVAAKPERERQRERDRERGVKVDIRKVKEMRKRYL